MLKAKLHKAVLDAVIKQTVGLLASRQLKPRPAPTSEQLAEESAEQLQPRTSTPDLVVPGLPHWKGVTDAAII